METLIKGAIGLGLKLDEDQIGKFEAYYRELIDWNQRVNLTRIIDREAVQVKHFLDSLSVVRALSGIDWQSLNILDVGTGAGFPGVPLKILYPRMELTLLDSVRKKTDFLGHLITTLNLDGVLVINERAETLAHDTTYRESFDAVVSRAVAPLSVVLELTLPFCKIGGRVVCQKDASFEQEPGDVNRALSLLGGRLEEVIPVELEGLNRQRRLVVIAKDSPTPEKYPRRPGMPARRPL